MSIKKIRKIDGEIQRHHEQVDKLQQLREQALRNIEVINPRLVDPSTTESFYD